MNKLNFKRVLVKSLVVLIVFTSFCICGASVYAADLPPNMTNDIERWLNSAGEHVEEYTYTNDDGVENVSYAIVMPPLDKTNHPNIGYESGKYVYLVRDGANNIVGKIPLNVDVAMASSTAGELPTLTSNNYQSYLTSDMGSTILQDKEGRFLKMISLDDKTVRQMAFVVELPDGTLVSSAPDDFSFDKKTLAESLWDWITSGVEGFLDGVVNSIGGIINDLLLWIADGINALINRIFDESGKKVTLYRVIFGEIEKLSIDYWGASDSDADSDEEENDIINSMIDTPPVASLKNVVSYWYGVLNGLAVSIYLAMLLYIGVRILLSSTGKANQKYKEMLKSWLVGIIILAFYPFVMKYVVILNDGFIDLIDQGDPEAEGETGDTMLVVRNLAESQGNIALTVVYIIMLVQLIVLLGVYYKRVLMVAFLITIFPIIATLYIWEQANGKSKSLSTWTREYVVVVLTQLIHAVIYVVLIDGAFQAFKTSDNWFIFILSVLFLFEGEKIIRSIFGLKSSANTIGDLATAGVAAWGATKALNRVFKKDSDSKSKDEEDKSKTDKQVEEDKKNAEVNRQLANKRYNDTSIKEAKEKDRNASAGSSGSGTGGASGSPGMSANQTNNLAAAQNAIANESLNKKTKKGIIHKALNATTGGVMKAGGVVLGLTSGMASGSMGTGIANAAIGNEIAGVASKLPKGIIGFGMGRFSGVRLRRKVLSGQMDEKLREAGFDLDDKFDENDAVSKAKAQVFREALAAQAEFTRRGGKVKGELKFLKEIDRARKQGRL